MRYEKRWCIKRHSHLFSYTWSEKQIYGVIRVIWATSCTRGPGRGQRRKWLRLWLTQQANTWAAGTSNGLFCGFPIRTDGISTMELPCNCSVAFGGSLSPVPWERRGTVHGNERMQPTLTTSKPALQPIRIQMVDHYFLNVWDYCNQLLSYTLLFKPCKS